MEKYEEKGHCFGTASAKVCVAVGDGGSNVRLTERLAFQIEVAVLLYGQKMLF